MVNARCLQIPQVAEKLTHTLSPSMKRPKMSLNHTLDIAVPFVTPRQALIAKRTLSPDPILRPDDIEVRYTARDNELLVSFEAVSDRVLRVAVSSVLESLKTVVEAMDEFDE